MTNGSIDVGDRYLIQWKNGQKHFGEIIEIRPLRSIKASIGNTIKLEDLDAKSFEYYVHYLNFDRRLDEWVSLDRIDIDSLQIENKKDLNHSSDSQYQQSSSGRGRKKRKIDDLPSSTITDTTAAAATTSGGTVTILNTREEKINKLNQLEKEHDEITKVKNIHSIILGKYEIETWYFSPYPIDYTSTATAATSTTTGGSGLQQQQQHEEEKLYICEFCLKYMKKEKTLISHSFKCNMKSPPGRLIYHDGSLAMYEIDGKDNKIYCQNLCLLSKLFLDHKTLYYDVEPFLFYILCEITTNTSTTSAATAASAAVTAATAGDGNATDRRNELHHIVGYFSKEKFSTENYNLACILTFPPYQRNGYGKFLMSISYELTKRENTVGSPEKPLSDLGKISYRSYWTYILLHLFLNNYEKTNESKNRITSISIQDISKLTGFKTDDILSTLHSLNMIKYWKGQHVVSVNKKAIENHLKQTKKIRLCNPNCLIWSPSTNDKQSKSKKV